MLSLAGVSRPAQAFLTCGLAQIYPNRPVLLVVDGLKTQESAHQDLETWLRLATRGSEVPPRPWFFPSWEILPHEDRLPHADVISERLETLLAICGHSRGVANRAPLIVASVEALQQRTFPRETLESRTRRLAQGDRIDPLDLVEWFEDQGYESEAKVTQKGEISMRGGIVDVFPPTSPWPVRVEFFGDEIESLRYFDPLTQVSRESVTEFVAPPAGELGLLKQMRPKASEEPSLGSPPRFSSLLEYLPDNTLIVLCEPEFLEARAEEYGRQVPAGDAFFIPWSEMRKGMIERGLTLLSLAEAENPAELVSLSPAESAAADSDPAVVPPLATAPQAGESLLLPSLEAFRPLPERPPEPQVAEAQRKEFFHQIHRWLRQGSQVHVFCNNEGERQRFVEIWSEYDLPANGGAAAPGAPPTSPIEVSPGLFARVATFSRGFLFPPGQLVVITDAEVFGRYRFQRPRRLRSPHAATTRSALDIDFADLEAGDYVVHLQHGIGRYEGTALLPLGAGRKGAKEDAVESGGQECLVIEYAPTDPAQPPPKLYVPLTEAHLVSKYVGVGKARPPLNTLGGTRWAKAKAHAERAVKDVAAELLAIQAARESLPGYSFGSDTPWQREFESAFVYEETPDQVRSINETKADMERPKPMDRLICGDVGFGKTEVAIRAAFKAVMGGKQVAVLVPTTVLAQQHYNTFRERMADYPVRIELLSRFRTRREQNKVVADLAAGAVDIVIGTHRLIQSDVEFKDLGLVVIDEEQRFGVLHKEKFKRLRQLVDVLTLSATPIPRTLYLALSGARDMSTLQTPPHDRLPVETVVTEYDERIIRDAIQRELNRGGQVFFLHNRVMTILNMAQKLANLVPHARLVVGHGQMDSDDLEEVMTKFINAEADVLLSTTIIESGLDIPNANTIIIDRADRFGLSDLYQLRGRVGRYKHQAYAYLLLPRHARLLTDVRKRMSAIKQYSTLGSGFKIAMRDLEIRGAGNLLGSEQSGHITAVGFELYCQLLKQSIAVSKGEKVKPRVEVQVRLDFLSLTPTDRPPDLARAVREPEATDQDASSPTEPRKPAASEGPAFASASIPYRYISDTVQRIEVYRKLAQATEMPALEALSKELRDRYGPLPETVELLLLVGELKVLAAEKGITAIEVKEQKLMLTRSNDYLMVGSKFPRLTKTTPGARLKEIRRLLRVL